jgi:hypothetical protein
VLNWRRLALPQLVWAFIYVIISFFAGWQGMGRYILPVFPVFISIALLIHKNVNVRKFVMYLSSLMLALFAIMYTHFYWVS